MNTYTPTIVYRHIPLVPIVRTNLPTVRRCYCGRPVRNLSSVYCAEHD